MMRYLSAFLIVFLFIRCSSDSVKAEPEIEQQPEEEVVVEEDGTEEVEETEDDEENQSLFNRLTIFSYEANGTVEESFWHKITLSDDLQSDISNITQVYNLNPYVSVGQQSKSEVIFSYSAASEANGAFVRKHVLFNIDTNTEIVFEDLLDQVGATENSSEFQLISNSNNFYGLYRENLIFDGNEIENYFVIQIDKMSGSQETLWSYEDVLRNDLEIDLGFGFPNTGVSSNNDYLFLSYTEYDYDTPGFVEEKDTHYIQVFDSNSQEVIKSFSSENPIGLVQNNNFICLSIDGALELYNLNTNLAKRFDDLNFNLGKPSYGFVNDSKFIFGAGSSAPGLGILYITSVDFNSGLIESIVISDVLKNSLEHIPSDVFLKGEAFTVEFEKERIICAYSYELDGEIKNELTFLSLEGEVLDYIELPSGYAPRFVFVN